VRLGEVTALRHSTVTFSKLSVGEDSEGEENIGKTYELMG